MREVRKTNRTKTKRDEVFWIIVHLLFFFASVFKLQTEAFFESQTFTGGAEMRVKITLACTECKQRNYDTTKNKKNDPDRLEMQKYCKFCRKHTLHKETK
jgi:large subunit ribosomal protein L33